MGFGLTLKRGLYFKYSVILIYRNMSHFKKFKTNSFCVGIRNYFGTNYCHGVVALRINGTLSSKGTKVFFTKRKRNKSMIFMDATIEAEGMKYYFKSVGKATVNFG